MQTLKWVGVVVLLLVAVIGIGYFAGKQKAVSESADTASVVGTAIAFGQSMHNVSLLAPAAELAVAMDQAYSRFASTEAISQWKQNPASAPGQKTSSPWPQGIEILSFTKQTDGSYVVTGNVLEVTSKEVGTDAYADKYPVTLTLQKIKGSWLITKFERGDVTPSAAR